VDTLNYFPENQGILLYPQLGGWLVIAVRFRECGAGDSGGSIVLINNLDAGDGLTSQWDRCNAIVLTLIMNYVSQDVYMGLFYSKNVASVWKELDGTYDKVDGSVIFNLLQKINSVKWYLMNVSGFQIRVKTINSRANYQDGYRISLEAV
ncbi:hypothetical protein Tco_1557286, partial [Tanacetum coccineum]